MSTREEHEALALALAMTARAITEAIADVLPPGHGVIFVVVPRRREVTTFVAGSIPHLDADATASALGQIGHAMADNDALTFSEFVPRKPVH